MNLKKLMLGAVFFMAVGCGGSPMESGEAVDSSQAELTEEDDLFCRAAPTCNEADEDFQVPSREECLQGEGTVCYESTRCGMTIRCTGTRPTTPPVQCRAIPTCKDGDEQTDENECLEDAASCYQVTLCGQTIWCEDAAR